MTSGGSMDEQRVIQRSEWGARHENGFGRRKVGELEVYVHHSVTIAPDLLEPFSDDYAAVRELERIGENRFGRGISYQFPITPAGLIFEGVSVDRIGAAIAKYNTPTVNIVWVGNYDVSRPPLPMLQATDWLLHHGAGRWWRYPVVTGGHRDAPGASTACPGRYAREVLHDLNNGKYHNTAQQVDNPITPPNNPYVPRKLNQDGLWGSSTTRKAQDILGTTVDGVVSSQARIWARRNTGLTTGWQWVTKPRGSRMILAHQKILKQRGWYTGELDGLVGPSYFRALQVDLNVPVADGEIWNPSPTVKTLQARLNTGRI